MDDSKCGCDESKALQAELEALQLELDQTSARKDSELDKLRGELECRTLELQNVETVMGARQKEYRERIAELEELAARAIERHGAP